MQFLLKYIYKSHTVLMLSEDCILIEYPLLLQKTCEPVMCAYKCVTVDVPYWGFGSRLEKFISKVTRPALDLCHGRLVCSYGEVLTLHSGISWSDFVREFGASKTDLIVLTSH